MNRMNELNWWIGIGVAVAAVIFAAYVFLG